jgi:hypothetical protein
MFPNNFADDAQENFSYCLLICDRKSFEKIVVYLRGSCVNWALFGRSGPVENARFTCQTKKQFTHELVK